jgi:hypothetical protein
MRKLSDVDGVYRALKRAWVEVDESGEQTIKEEAFFRRDPASGFDLSGISINPCDRFTVNECALGRYRNSPGVARLVAGDVRSIPLTIELDKDTHGTISGLPWLGESRESKREAERLARSLRRISMFHPVEP